MEPDFLFFYVQKMSPKGNSLYEGRAKIEKKIEQRDTVYMMTGDWFFFV